MTLTYTLPAEDDDGLVEWTIRHTLDGLSLTYTVDRTEDDRTGAVTFTVRVDDPRQRPSDGV